MYNDNFIEVKKRVKHMIDKYKFYCLSTIGNSLLNEVNNYKYDTVTTQFDYDYICLPKEVMIKKVEYINYFRYSFNKLTIQERKIIYFSYIDNENNHDDRLIANSLGFSLGYFYTKKKQALIRFAFALGIEVL